MPSFRKLNPDETTAADQRSISVRAQVLQEYDALLADFVIGEYGRAELLDGERRNAVRSRLHAAARRRGLALRFRPGPSEALIFRVEAVTTVVSPPLPAAAPLVGARRAPALPRPPRRRQTSAERYRDVLPRWMREREQPNRRDGSKRNAR